jgi:hypothetical protein
MSDEILEEDGYDPFDFPDEVDEAATGLDLNLLAQAGATAFYDAIQNAANGTARSQQQREFRLGISNLGHCRQYAKLMTEEVPFSDERDKTAAFFGTVAGDAIEQQLKKEHPDWLIQDRVMFHGVPGTCDVCIPSWAGCSYEEFIESRHPDYIGEPRYMQGIWDGKSKAELETIKKLGPDQQQIFQLHAYAKGQIEKGNLDPTKPIVVMDVFFDRSGKNQQPYAVAHLYHEDVITFIEEWISDVTYAVRNGEDASRDKSRDWCHAFCEYATICRGHDTDVEGLITDPSAIATIEAYREATLRETAAKKEKAALKHTMENIEPGSTGTLIFRKTWVNGSSVSFEREGYLKMEVRDVPKAKPPTKKQLAAEAAAKALEAIETKELEA